MNAQSWRAVIPAITTPFRDDLSIDHAFLAEHARWMIAEGCRAVVAPGSLGEGATLSHDEKLGLWRTLVHALGPGTPVIAAVAAASTAEAVRLATDAQRAGCRGLMVLPPYVYRGSWPETRAHLAAILRATRLSCMLYNNPLAYATDILPAHVAELAAQHPNLHAVKESSADVRRITAIRAALGDRLAILVGVDDLIVEGLAAGAVGWIAGLVNALPRESVRLFDAAANARHDEARRLYEWFLPLLRMDVVPEFVHLIKLVQEEVGRGRAIVRPPRLPLPAPDADAARRTIRACLAARPV